MRPNQILPQGGLASACPQPLCAASLALFECAQPYRHPRSLRGILDNSISYKDDPGTGGPLFKTAHKSLNRSTLYMHIAFAGVNRDK